MHDYDQGCHILIALLAQGRLLRELPFGGLQIPPKYTLAILADLQVIVEDTAGLLFPVEGGLQVTLCHESSI